MLLIYDPHGDRLHQRVAASFPSRAVVQRWCDLHRLAPAAEGCILLVRTLRDPRTLQELERYRRCFPRHPTVLVVDGAREEHLLGRRFAGWEVVWMVEVRQALLEAALRAARAASPSPRASPSSFPAAPAIRGGRERSLPGEGQGS